MADEFPVLPANVIEAKPTRRNARPAYPWSRLDPGEGFYFKSGTSILYARNQASMMSLQLDRKFRVQISVDSEELQCVRVDGLMYDPLIAPDGKLSRPTTQRMVWYPLDETAEEYRDRMTRDAHVERIKMLADDYPTEQMEEILTQFIGALQKSKDQRAAQPVEDAEGGKDDPI